MGYEVDRHRIVHSETSRRTNLGNERSRLGMDRQTVDGFVPNIAGRERWAVADSGLRVPGASGERAKNSGLQRAQKGNATHVISAIMHSPQLRPQVRVAYSYKDPLVLFPESGRE